MVADPMAAMTHLMVRDDDADEIAESAELAWYALAKAMIADLTAWPLVLK